MKYFNLKFLTFFLTALLAFGVGWADEYVLLTDVSQLEDGKTLIIASKKNNSGNVYAMYEQKTNNWSQTPSAISVTSANTIVAPGDAHIFTLEGSEGAWYFNTGDDTYLYAASSSNNLLKSAALSTAGDNAKAKIVINEAGASQITFQGTSTKNRLKYNSNNNLFSCYSTGQEDVYIYVKTEGSSNTPYITVDPPTGLTINDANGDNKTGTLTATLTNGQGDLTAATNPSDKWSWNNNTVTFNGKELGAEGTVTFSSTNATNVTADLEYNYTGPLYIIGYVNGGDWSANNMVKMEGPDDDGIYTVTLTTTPNGNNESEISFSKRMGSVWNAWGEIYEYRFVPVSNGPWGLTEGTLGGWHSLDFDPSHVDAQKIVMPAGTYTISIDAKNNKFMIERYEVPVPKVYNKVVDESQLIAGKNYILVNEKNAKFMGQIDGYGNAESGPTITEGSVDISSNKNITELTLSGDENGWSFYNGEGYISWPTGNALSVDDEIDDYSKWTVSYFESDTKGSGFILTNVYDANRVLQYNNASPRFACYTGSQLSAVLYVQDGVDPVIVPTVATPTFNPAGGTYTEVQNVEILCATDGATIYYTTDGTEPSNTSTPYSSAITIDKTTTIKAIAVKDGMENSAIAEATYTINLPITVSTLAAANALEDDTEFTFTENDVVVTFKQSYTTTNNATHTLIGLRDKNENDKTDGTGKGGSVFFDISSNIANSLSQGTVLNPDWKAKVDIYNGWVELVGASNVNTQDETVTVEPFDRTGVTLTKDNQSEYIKLNNVTISGTTATAGTAKATTYNLFNRFGVEYEDGNYEYLIGVVNYYKTNTTENVSIYPLELKKVEKVATPTFDPEGGEYTTIQNVTIATTTEGAAISYKIGENGEWKTYSEPIEVAESCTITAKATKTGMLDSNEASATYTINLPTLDAPTFEPEAGTYDVAQNVAISATNGATISYKIGEDGEWKTYSEPIEVAESCTIFAKASKKGYIDSEVNSAAYVIRKEAKLSFGDETAFTVYPKDDFTAPELTTTPTGLTPITYSIEGNENEIVLFDESDGTVVIGEKTGTVKIIASFAGNETYMPASASYTITVEPKPYLVADETVDMGTEKTKEFDVVGENLKGVVTLTCNNENFVVTPTEITPTEGAVEQTVTVTYNGSSYTDETATITVASQDAESVIVTVKAHIAKPALIAVDDELEFEALVGKTDSKTFYVTGENLKDNVTLTLDDVNGVYSIDPTSITKEEAEADGGKKVTVTYTPMTENIDDATITVASTDADPVTVTLTGMATLPNPVIVVDDEPINMGTNPTGTFDLTAENLRGNITLTSDNPNFTVEPATITPEEAEDIVTVTVTYNGDNTEGETAHITITTEGLDEPVTITVTAKAETYVNIAAPTFAPAAGTYTEPKEVAIACATPGVTIKYSINGGTPQDYTKPFMVSESCTVTAMATMGSKVVYNDSEATATYEIKALPAATITDGYYKLINNALPNQFTNVAGRRTLNFVSDAAQQAGTVFRVMTDPDTIGQVETLRSQGVDMQGYAKRAMNYVTPIVQMVVNKLNDMDGVDDATGTGSILGENGLGKILAEFNKSFDYHLYVEGNAGAYRIYARTPSMQRVVDFYNNPDNKSQIQEKLPMLEDYINQVLAKIRSKVPAGMNANVFEPFSLVKVWEKMGGKLINPEDDEMGFYDQVLSNKEYVWDFAYQTAKIYLDNIKGTQTYDSLDPEYKLYIEKMEEIRPETKFFIIQNGNELDYVREDHTYIQNNNDQTFWTLTERTDFTVNFPEENKYGSKLVTTLYTDFAYDVPDNVTAYKVTDIDANGIAKIADLGKNVPAQTPVLLMTDATAKATTKNVTLNTTDGTRPDGNLLEGPDYLINKYKITSPTVEALFAIAAGIVGGEESDAYQTYVKPYEYLKLRTSGTVNNRYFWGLNSDDLKKCSEKNSEDKLDCVVRSLGLDENDKNIGFYRNREALLANQAFIPTIEFNPILLEVVATPTFDPEAGTYNEAQTVTITCETEGATIYYKIGDEDWTEYNEAINVAQTKTIQAYAVKDGLGDSEIAEATYTIELPAEAPTFDPVPGSYTEAQQVTIIAPEGATVSYRIDGGEWQTYTEGEKIQVEATQTIEAKVEMEGMSESAVATGYYVIDIPEALPTDMPVFDGYYSILNSGKYANVQGRKTLTFTTEPDAQAGTVIRLKSDNTGKVEVLRSQAADLQRYAYRALDYVPDIVQIVVDKLGAEGEGHILGQEGLDAIMDKFDKSFKPDLYIEKAGENGYRIYGKTPSMQPVVDFYRENKDKVEAKLPNLVEFINSALAKLRNKANQAGMDGDNVFVDFDLQTIWERMGGTLTKPEDAESTMAFYREVLNYKDNVWNFAYQTATFYLEKIKNTGTYESLSEQLGEFAQYLDKIDQVNPDFKYYIVANEGVTKPDFISQGNADIINNAARTIWTIEDREKFTVTFPAENKLGDEYVTTLYTDFAYTLPEGVTAWAVESVNEQGIAKLAKVDGTTIAAQTPVLLKSTTAGDVVSFGITTAEGTVPATNELVGPDYLIETYQIKTPEVVKLFEAIKSVLGENIYNDLVDKYGHLQLRNSGTVNNKYFWGLNEEEVKSCAETNPETGKLVKVVRSLGIKDDILGFNDNEHVYTNKALLVSTEHSAINFTLRGDINRNGKIEIGDVTALIDILLDLPAEPYHEASETYPKGLDYEAADFNEKDGISIDDVTALIDYLLGV